MRLENTHVDKEMPFLDYYEWIFGENDKHSDYIERIERIHNFLEQIRTKYNTTFILNKQANEYGFTMEQN